MRDARYGAAWPTMTLCLALVAAHLYVAVRECRGSGARRSTVASSGGDDGDRGSLGGGKGCDSSKCNRWLRIFTLLLAFLVWTTAAGALTLSGTRRERKRDDIVVGVDRWIRCRVCFSCSSRRDAVLLARVVNLPVVVVVGVLAVGVTFACVWSQTSQTLLCVLLPRTPLENSTRGLQDVPMFGVQLQLSCGISSIVVNPHRRQHQSVRTASRQTTHHHNIPRPALSPSPPPAPPPSLSTPVPPALSENKTPQHNKQTQP